MSRKPAQCWDDWFRGARWRRRRARPDVTCPKSARRAALLIHKYSCPEPCFAQTHPNVSTLS